MKTKIDNTNKFRWLIPIISLILLTTVFFLNATHGLYLFDTSIVYYYGYLLKLGYKPFVDFTSPLLPFPGLLQEICYRLFGMNYFSGSIGAWIVCLIQYLLLFYFLRKMKKSTIEAGIYSFILCLLAEPFVGNLYYNHLLISLISVFLILTITIYKNVLVSHNSKVPYNESNWWVALQYILITFILLTKIQIGLYFLLIAIFFDLSSHYYRFKFQWILFLKFLFIRIVPFLASICIILYSTQTNLADYFQNIKHLSLTKNLYGDRISDFLLYPSTIDGNIGFTPSIIYLLFIIVYFRKSKPFLLKNVYVFLLYTSIYFAAFIFIMNSKEANNILLSFSVILFILLENIYEYFNYSINKANEVNFLKFILRPALLISILVYSIPYSMLSMRKDYSEQKRSYPLNLSFQNKYSFNHANPRLDIFFNHLKINQDQVNNFAALDSLIRESKAHKIFFGPELEMFNIIYDVKPLKKWPVWIHHNLTISIEDLINLEPIFKNEQFELIVLSKSRMGGIPFISDEYLKNYNKYSDNAYWFVVYCRKDIDIIGKK